MHISTTQELHRLPLAPDFDPVNLSPEQLERNAKVAIATSTFYKSWYPGHPEDESAITSDKLRGDLALETIVAAGSRGYNMVVVDDGSDPAFADAIVSLQAQYPKLVFERQAESDPWDTPSSPQIKTPRMSAGRRQALRTASEIPDVEVVAWVEPEKVSIVRDCMDGPVDEILEGRADVVVPSRDSESFATYPEYQVGFEQESNIAFNGLLRAHGLRGDTDPDLDAWIGPRFIRNTHRLMRLFQRRFEFTQDISSGEVPIDRRSPELWTNALFIPLAASIVWGYKVSSVPVPYRHPAQQTQFEAGLDSPEFTDKRRFQKESILTAIAHYLQVVRNVRSGRWPEGPGAHIRQF